MAATAKAVAVGRGRRHGHGHGGGTDDPVPAQSLAAGPDPRRRCQFDGCGVVCEIDKRPTDLC
jgi:hypothetical protein